jgi:heterodisulfide reductase subunit A
LRLAQAIRAQQLERVLVAGCTPRLVHKLFDQAGQQAGLPPGCVEIADIREQCSRVHAGDPAAALDKAAALIEAGVARLDSLTPYQPLTSRVVRSALVVGSSLAGLTAALTLAQEGILVTLVEASNRLGGELPFSDPQAAQLIAERIEALQELPNLVTLFNARLTEVSGGPGDYQVTVAHAGQVTRLAAGAILVATRAAPRSLGGPGGRWYDRQHVKTQAEFEAELDLGAVHDPLVMILCAQEFGQRPCSRLCCLAALRQALRAKSLRPQADITILFRQLYLGPAGGEGEQLLTQAKEAGVTFFRWQQNLPPEIKGNKVELNDSLTGQALHLPYERLVLAMPFEPQASSGALASLLRLPQDEQGYLVEPRIRLRPGRYSDDGIYVLGGSHQPATLSESLFQAYLASAQARRFLEQESIQIEAPIAQIDPSLCTGCAECVQACLSQAIHMERRLPADRQPPEAEVLSLAAVEPLRCTGCGSCAVACPVKAIHIPGWEDTAILAQISALLRPRPELNRAASAAVRPSPLILALACEWSAYAAADLAGAHQALDGASDLAYPSGVRLLRMNCSARFDPNHILWAFLNGASGVFLGACPLGECHYGDGSRLARQRVEGLRKQLAEHGIDPLRIRLEFLAGDDAPGLANALRQFASQLAEISPIARKP